MLLDAPDPQAPLVLLALLVPLVLPVKKGFVGLVVTKVQLAELERQVQLAPLAFLERKVPLERLVLLDLPAPQVLRVFLVLLAFWAFPAPEVNVVSQVLLVLWANLVLSASQALLGPVVPLVLWAVLESTVLLVKPVVMATLGVMVLQVATVSLDTRENAVILAMPVLLVLQVHLVLKAPWAPLANMETVVNLALLVLLVPSVLLVQEALVVHKASGVTRESLVIRGPEVFLA